MGGACSDEMTNLLPPPHPSLFRLGGLLARFAGRSGIDRSGRLTGFGRIVVHHAVQYALRIAAENGQAAIDLAFGATVAHPVYIAKYEMVLAWIVLNQESTRILSEGYGRD